MSPEQRAYYATLSRALSNGGYPRVDGNISYLFVFVYAAINRLKTTNLTQLRRELLSLAEAYHYEPKFPDYCRQWAYEALLAEGKYEQYLTLTEPENPFVTRTHLANQRCNVLHHVKTLPTGTDLAQLFGVRATRAVQKYGGAVRDALDEAVSKDQEAHGSLLDRMLQEPEVSKQYGNALMSGIPFSRLEFAFPVHCFYVHSPTGEQVRLLLREAENAVREKVGVPRVGEGWVAETALYRAIEEAFPETRVVQHGRPTWLGRQHLDVWLPEWRLAVEFHGSQHFAPVAFFGGEAAFESTRERDTRKERICRENEVSLVVATESDTHEGLIARIREARKGGNSSGAQP
jgi:hypothetical protein